MKTYIVAFEHFRILFLLAVASMLFMPFGTFDPAEPAFYSCIIIAAATYLFIVFMLRRFQKDVGKIRNKNQEIAVSIVFMSVLFMIFMPHGTFDPTNPGFYTCIAGACSTEFLTRFMLKKFQSPRPA